MNNTGTATPRLDLLGPILQEGAPEDVYVSPLVLPTLVVQKRRGAIPSFLFSDAQILSIKHAPKTGFAVIQSKLGQNDYACTEAGVEEPLSVEDYEILGKDQAQELIARKLVHVVLRARDYALGQALFSATGESTFATNLVTASATWDNASGVPLTNVLDAKTKVLKQTGSEPDTMLIGWDAYVKLCVNDQIRTAWRNNFGVGQSVGEQAAVVQIPTSQLATLFGLREIIVAKGVYDANKEGAAAKNLGFIFPGTYALVFNKAKRQGDVREVALGRTFVYDLATEFNQLTTMNILDMAKGLMIEQYPDPKVNADFLRAREYVDMQVLVPTAGSLIKSI